MLQLSRTLALLFAVGLGIGEAVINWGHWQFAPLWIVDYIIVIWLLLAYWQTRLGRNIPTLISGWAFTAGVFYMALFIQLDPELTALGFKSDRTMLLLIGGMLVISIIGVVASFLAQRRTW